MRAEQHCAMRCGCCCTLVYVRVFSLCCVCAQEESKAHATNERMRAAVDAYGSNLRSGVVNRKNLALYFAAHSRCASLPH